MLYNNNLIEQYNDLKENLAELLLLRENIISIRDDLITDDTTKLKALYKNNIKNLEENQMKLESDIVSLIRAGEILKYLEFNGAFVNLNQVVDALNREKQNSKDSNKNNFYISTKLFEDLNFENSENTDFLFKEIAKEISPSINKNVTNESARMWKETLRAKSDEDEVSLNRIFLESKRVNTNSVHSIDNMCDNINNIEINLKVVNNEITEITKVCRENFDDEKIEELSKLIKVIDIKNTSLRNSIKTLMAIRKNMIDGFIAMLPPTKILN